MLSNKNRLKTPALLCAMILALTACGGAADSSESNGASALSDPPLQIGAEQANNSDAPSVSDTESGSSDAAGSGTESESSDSAGSGTESESSDSSGSGTENSTSPLQESAGDVWDLPSVGMTIPMPETYIQNRDRIFIDQASQTISGKDGDLISIARFFLYPVSGEALMAMDQTAYDAITPGVMVLAVVAGMPEGKDAAYLNASLEAYDVSWNASFSEPLGSDGRYTFYECRIPSLDAQSPEVSDDLKPVYDAVREEMGAALRNGTYEDTVGSVRFETTDTDGNPVDSAALFAGHKVTMVNLWTTWCTYCIREMPEIEAIHQEFKDQGLGIVGILMDANEAGALEEAADLISQTGITYQTLMPVPEIDAIIPALAYPTTYFIDENGNLLGDPVVGADINTYRARIADYLD